MPRAVERGGACHRRERQRSDVGEAVVLAGAEVRQEAEGALNRVKEGVARASDGTKGHFEQLKSKVDGDMQRLNERAVAF